MNVFEAAKGNVTTRQAAEVYGIQVRRLRRSWLKTSSVSWIYTKRRSIHICSGLNVFLTLILRQCIALFQHHTVVKHRHAVQEQYVLSVKINKLPNSFTRQITRID